MHAPSSCSRTFVSFLVVALAVGCGDGGLPPTDDAAVTDASTIDAFDPYATPEVCSSGATWTHGDIGSALMHPGRACITCHATNFRAPRFTVVGTVYPTAHEPDDCNGVNGFNEDVHILVIDANGVVQDLLPNDVGNFGSGDVTALPITAQITYQGRSRTMTIPANSGDCNSCHTDQGTNAAPGRLMLP